MSLLFQDDSKPVSAKDFAYHELKKKIWKKELSPNEIIGEAELVKELGVSRTPLREALSILEHEKLLIRQPNKRLKVSPISIKKAEEIFEVRAHLECIAVREAIENTTQEDIEKLGIIVHLTQQKNDEQDFEKTFFYGEQFHYYIYQLSGNSTVQTILMQLDDHIKRYRYLILSRNGGSPKDKDKGHEAIFQAIKNRDTDEAERLVKRHLEKGLEVVRIAITEYENSRMDKE